MVDWLLNADIWIKILGVLTSVLGLVTAVVSLRKTRAPEQVPGASVPRHDPDRPQAATAPRLRLLSFGGEPAKPWSPLWLKFFVGVLGILTLAMAALALFVFVSEPSLFTSFPLLFFGACTVAYVAVAKRIWGDPEQGSLVKREARLNIQGSHDHLWDECIAALKRMKVEIRTVDPKNGLIEGKSSLSWKSFGEIIVIQITSVGADEYSIHVRSDSVIISTAFDYGKNAANISRFVQELVR